jgi:hypothetical protein
MKRYEVKWKEHHDGLNGKRAESLSFRHVSEEEPFVRSNWLHVCANISINMSLVGLE